MNHPASHPIVRLVLSALLAAITSVSARSEEKEPAATDLNSALPSSAALVPGQHLRVSAASPTFTGMMTGTLVKLGPDSLILADPERNMISELPRNTITRVEVGHERRRTRKGLLIGLGVGALGALGVGLSQEADCGRYDPYDRNLGARPCTNGEKAGLSAVVIGFYAGLGAWIGHRKKTHDWADALMEDWKPSAHERTWNVTPTLSGEARGAGLRLHVTW